jgi:hypothetical protein
MKPRRMGWARHMALMGEKRNAYRGLMVIAEGELTFKI